MDDGVRHGGSEPTPEIARSFRLTFGLERLGLVALRAPVFSLLVIIALTIIAAFGIIQLRVDDSLSELFRTETPEFKQYEAIDRRFPSSEYDVLAVVQGDNLLTRKGLRSFADLEIELQL